MLTHSYRFCGLTRAQQSSALTVLRADAPNWVYQYTHPSQPGKWTQILPEVISFSEMLSGGSGEHEHGVERGKGRMGRGEVGHIEPLVPLPRYAHQVVYDERTKKVYMHGGNAGEGRAHGGEEKENEEARVGGGAALGTSAGTGASTRREAEGGGGNGNGDGDGDGNSAGGEHEGSKPGLLRETRLDDFWVMDLVR